MLERLRFPTGPVPSLTRVQSAVAGPVAGQREVQLQQGVVRGLNRPCSADMFDWLFAGMLAHPSGGVAGWRERRSGRLSDEYPEITGYYLSAAVFAGMTGTAAVVRAADWLCARIEANASASRRVDGSAIYNFDQGIIAAGLIKYGVRARNARAVAAGVRAASRLRDQLSDLGHLPPLDPTAGHPHGRPATWSTVGRLHLAKTVQCLLLAAELGVAGMREAAHTLIDDVSSTFSLTNDGLRDEAGRVNLHATSYALEGFWIWDAANRTTGLRDILHSTVDELLSYRLPSGGFPRLAATPVSREQSDVHAQVIRLAALLGRTGEVRPSIARLRQVASPADFGWSVPYEPQAPDIHENTWVTMFAAQALELVDGPADLEWWELI